MTKSEGIPKSECRKGHCTPERLSIFGLRISFVVRHSSFVIREPPGSRPLASFFSSSRAAFLRLNSTPLPPHPPTIEDSQRLKNLSATIRQGCVLKPCARLRRSLPPNPPNSPSVS